MSACCSWAKGKRAATTTGSLSTRLLDRTEGREAFRPTRTMPPTRPATCPPTRSSSWPPLRASPLRLLRLQPAGQAPVPEPHAAGAHVQARPFLLLLPGDGPALPGRGDAQAPAFGTCLAASVGRPGSGGGAYAVFSTRTAGRQGASDRPLPVPTGPGSTAGWRPTAMPATRAPRGGPRHLLQALPRRHPVWWTRAGMWPQHSHGGLGHTRWVCAWPCLTRVHMPPMVRGRVCAVLHGQVRRHPHGASSPRCRVRRVGNLEQ